MKALNQDDDRRGLPIAPLIDIVFLLLIFFLVATTFYEVEKDITIRLAESNQGDTRAPERRIVVVNVKESGILVVNERVRTAEEVEDMLRSMKTEARDFSVVVRCDRKTYHEHFVRVLDLCERVGVGRVAIAIVQTEF